MPKMNDRERLAKIEADQHNLAHEAQSVRRSLRAQYGALVADIAVEKITEREFREVLNHTIRIGGGVAIAALKGLSPAAAPAPVSPVRRPSDEHGEAARRRPAPVPGAASAGERPGD